jgi:uncharacterized protein (TIGR04255 family)
LLFPTSDREVYKHNPLELVICQLRFPTILAISTGEPAPFQDLIREEYPIYKREDGELIVPKEIPKELSILFSQMPFPKIPEATVHKFLTEDESKYISLKSDFLAYRDNKYKNWDEFKKRMMTAKSYFENLYKPAFYSRVGLRYQDVLNKKILGLEGESWDTLLNKSILGFLGEKDIKDSIQEINNNTLFRIDDVKDGYVRINHGLIETDDGQQLYRIDADFFVSDRREKDEVERILDTFNKLAGYFFRWATTEKLKVALNSK